MYVIYSEEHVLFHLLFILSSFLASANTPRRFDDFWTNAKCAENSNDVMPFSFLFSISHYIRISVCYALCLLLLLPDRIQPERPQSCYVMFFSSYFSYILACTHIAVYTQHSLSSKLIIKTEKHSMCMIFLLLLSFIHLCMCVCADVYKVV